ncbi:MAG: hypothetical protein QM762_07565 [Chryseolinea sp.]
MTEVTNADASRLFKVPLAFLLIASMLGLLLRSQQIWPLPAVVYSHLLHAHSHVMFLGWIFNVLLIAFSLEFAEVKMFRALFWVLQSLVLGMLVSFPLQGYGVFSIVFSSLHTIGTFAFIILFLRATRGKSSFSLMLAKAALVFFVLSSFGPFALGYLKSNAPEHSNIYRFAIYFYLHFQYNGFFFFGILSLIARLAEIYLPSKDLRRLQYACHAFIIACLPAFLLSTLWSKPSLIFNIIGMLSAITQLAGLLLIWAPMKKLINQKDISGNARLFFALSSVALIIKFGLQFISAFPAAAEFANEFRHVVIAYLHLVLVGFTSFFLFGWLIHKKVIPATVHWETRLIAGSFIISEFLLAVSPWSENANTTTVELLRLVFLLSCLMVAGLLGTVVKAYRTNS